MRAALERFYGKINSGSTALLFFSGFGIQSDRQSYMIPVNAQIWSESDVRRDGYSLDFARSRFMSLNVDSAPGPFGLTSTATRAA